MRNFGIISPLLLPLVTFVCSVSCLYITREKGQHGGSSLNDLAAGYGGRPPSYYGASSSKAQASSAKSVIVHVIVGNTYPYTIDNWKNDIGLASAHGIDGFALNVGNDEWQMERVASAYAAAAVLGTGFKLFMSFDMTAMPCASVGDMQRLQKYIMDYKSHPNQMLVGGRVFVSTFSGEGCRFGAGSLNDGWVATLKSASMPPVWFVPSFFVDPATFPSLTVMDGYFTWNAGWPMGNSTITFDADKAVISQLGGRSYMAPCSPWFFTHYGPNTYNKNWIYRADDWLFIERWELMIKNRDRIDSVQVISWNDYGESHYIGPIEGAQPMSQSWVDGFDHQGWLELEEYYISAFKSGSYPFITRDKVFLWARLYPAAMDAPADLVGKPYRWEYTQDYLWAVVFSTGGSVSVTLSCGGYSETTKITGAGAFKIKMTFANSASGGQVSAVMKRNGVAVLDFVPANFTFDRHPSLYNFNAFVAGSW